MEPYLDRVVLEMSLKPFTALDTATITRVCQEAFRQWYPLTKLGRECGILLWISEGSEILTWKGDLAEPFEWARYIGTCNTKARAYDHEIDPRRVARLYRENPPAFTYDDLKRVVDTLRRVGEEDFGLRVVVGATFDPGPEFAESPFKFELHPEIMGRGDEAHIGKTVWFVRAWSHLKADATPYAAYPDGIPEGTPFGEFLGRQSQSFLQALGFDYIWLSNGFGFSHFGWNELGENFDGEQFNTSDYGELSERIMSFWYQFCQECSYPIEVRGTNFSTGIDLAKDSVPALDIYDSGFISAPPPNYPTGAINYDFGLEMVGYMSRIAHLPGEVFPFRYYINDPWFVANPWWNRYGREPFDIYLPLSVSRLGKQGQVETPRLVELLTIDTERGLLDERCALEVIPHLRRAIEDGPDEAGPIVWLYPFHEYHAMAKKTPDRIGVAYFGDWFMRSAVNNGLPLNTVLSTADMKDALAAGALEGRVICTPTPFLTNEYEQELIRHVEQGGQLVLYGPMTWASESFRRFLNIAVAEEGLTGDCSFYSYLEDDTYTAWQGGRRLEHNPLLSAGPLTEMVADSTDTYTTVLATAQQDDTTRAYCVYRCQPNRQGGKVAWVRGSSSFQIHAQQDGRRIARELPKEEYWDTSSLIRQVLDHFGLSLRQVCSTPATKRALVVVHRHRNAFVFSGFKADTTVQLRLTMPDGAPILPQKEGLIAGDHGTYTLEKSFHVDCNVFVRQSGTSAVSCRDLPPLPPGKERHLVITNLLDAEVTVYPPLDRWDEVEVRENDVVRELRADKSERCMRIQQVRGELAITW